LPLVRDTGIIGKRDSLIFGQIWHGIRLCVDYVESSKEFDLDTTIKVETVSKCLHLQEEGKVVTNISK
jgi:hypothetical protein